MSELKERLVWSDRSVRLSRPVLTRSQESVETLKPLEVISTSRRPLEDKEVDRTNVTPTRDRRTSLS